MPDQLSRPISVVSGLGRLAIGIGLFAFPRQALRALGFGSSSSPGTETVAIARIAGGRDIAMGVETLLALDDPARLRRANLMNATADAGDAITFAAALGSGDDEVRNGALRGLPAAALAAAGGLAAAAWLSREGG